MTPPDGWRAALVETLGIELWRIPIVIASAILIYFVFVILLRIFGARILSGITSFDAVVVIMIGAVAGRVIIGHPPTVAAGAIGLVTLMCLEALFGSLRGLLPMHRALNNQPILVVAHGAMLTRVMRRVHVSPDDVQIAIRKAGLGRLQDAQCVILEPSGALSVIPVGTPVDRTMMQGVDEANELRGNWTSPGGRSRLVVEDTVTPQGESTTGEGNA
ncbi:DUF421 domain-containing protein [Brevibacterium gallinarum]|uniref:DUF421 domain-containing protein n=1 Tax=Brevibacterium gallinarum TaxID=2762220 RepID=A0ABR8WRG7_9MICO|nr:YetF domain-containing protein [Brevibacterium gallinarum]MBD8019666.1 DUF421 domain-containing protein [Brevibacterium gallinarum]